jgi:hypothetical protein
MSAELALQGAIVARLKADAGVSALIAGRVYDRVPATYALPYVQIRTLQGIEDAAECIDGREVYIDLDAWSDKPGKVEASRVAEAVRKALNFAPLALEEPHALVEIAHRDTDITTESDALTSRARMTFRALVESK